MQESELYICPHCQSVLSSGRNKLSCSSCGSDYSRTDGVYDFLGESYEWSFGADGDQDELMKRAKETGWRSAVEAVYSNPDQRRWLTDISRGRPVDLLGLHANARILDVGCGWGAISLYAAQQGHSVHAIDITPSALGFLAIRCREEDVASVYPARADLLKGSPFPENSFDAIVLNGVLEWVPSFHEGDPWRIQNNLLKTCQRLLRDGGKLLLGIENRIGLPYWFGVPDEHTRLKWITLLPRRLADRLSRKKTGKPYRNYTHSRRGLRTLLRSSGFSETTFHIPFPNYRTPDRIVAENDRQLLWKTVLLMTEAKTHLPVRHLDRIGLDRVLASFFAAVAPAYYVVGRKG